MTLVRAVLPDAQEAKALDQAYLGASLAECMADHLVGQLEERRILVGQERPRRHGEDGDEELGAGALGVGDGMQNRIEQGDIVVQFAKEAVRRVMSFALDPYSDARTNQSKRYCTSAAWRMPNFTGFQSA